MQGVTDILLLLSASSSHEEEESLVPDEVVREAMPRLAQQACEKIDRTRGLAAR